LGVRGEIMDCQVVEMGGEEERGDHGRIGAYK